MIDHISVAVRDLDRSAAFYDALLQPLGLSRLVTRPATVGFGRKYPEFWLNARPGMLPFAADTGAHDTGAHCALRAPSAEAVRAFHAAAIAHGGLDDGAPGQRAAAQTTYFGAFVRDPDGNKIEAVYFPDAQRPPKTGD